MTTKKKRKKYLQQPSSRIDVFINDKRVATSFGSRLLLFLFLFIQSAIEVAVGEWKRYDKLDNELEYHFYREKPLNK